MQKKVFVVSHTHWDREWYLTKSQFQMMNVDMMSCLLDILDKCPDFASFMLDGQLVAVEDYLEVCPEQKERLRRLVREGRLVIGPWYVLPDEYLASGEAHIRNFMQGMRLAEDFGGGMRLGYLPDSFGHPSQMPQIIAGLGMREMLFWRGPGPEVAHAEFDWVGKDGTEILALNMVYGYSNAACLKEDPEIRHRRLDHEIEKMGKLSRLGLVLLMNGSDHIAPDGRVAQWLKEYQQAHPELEIRHCTPDAYVKEAFDRRENNPLQKVHGELRSGYRAYLLGDTLSTRMPIKQQQRRMEVLVENQLEPLMTQLSLAGLCPYPGDKLRYLWKLVLQNLPHDSICGCSIDQVHREMFGRYKQMEEIGGHLFEKAARAMVRKPAQEGYDGEIAVFSSQLQPQQRQVKLTLEKVLHPVRYVDYEQDQRLLEFEGAEDGPVPTGAVLLAPDGRQVNARVENARMVDTVECNMMTQPTMNRVLSMECSFVDELAPLSLTRYAYRFTYDSVQPRAAAENEYYTVTAAADGTLSVLCKETAQWYHGLVKLVDMADVGDAYTFDGLPQDEQLTMVSGSIRIVSENGKLTIHGVLRLPVACTEDRRARSEDTVDCPVMIEACAPRHAARVEVAVTLHNHAMDHRVMALFPLGAQAAQCLCDSTFSLEDHKIVRHVDAGAYQGWREKPNNGFFQKNFADLSGGERGLCVMVKGLPQFEVQADEGEDQLRLTLLRCVGWLSRKDLRSRDGNGGWSIQTPEAQEQGERRFEFAVMPHGKRQPHALYLQAMDYVAAPVALQVSRTGAAKPERLPSLCRVSDERVVLSALKQAENGEGTIIRLCNMSAESFGAILSFDWATAVEIRQASLDERVGNIVAEKCAAAEVRFRPWQVITLLVKEA